MQIALIDADIQYYLLQRNLPNQRLKKMRRYWYIQHYNTNLRV